MAGGAPLAAFARIRRVFGAILVIRTRWLVLAMVAAITAVGLLAYWDELRRSEGGLDDFADEQASVASAAALAIASELPASGDPNVEPRVVATLRALERDGVRALVVAPNGVTAFATDGSHLEVPGLADATRSRARSLRIARDDAGRLGLPARTAELGLAALPGGWSVGVLATAEKQRDRDRAGLRRLWLSIALATGLVALFGGLALARQRAQLELVRDAELERVSRAATMAALGSGVAHELSTPLGVIVGRAEQMLGRANGDERLAKNAQAILDQADHIDRVVRGLLGLARGAPIALQEIDPQKLVREAAALVDHRFARAHVQLATAVTDGLLPVRCEPLLFKHALVNLLLNACDASPTGGTVRLDVRADAGEVSFVITDEGEGITPAAAARAIEPFFTTKPAGQGTGLGLAIANEIASTHRGTLSIAATEPRGTRAAISIPLGGAHA
jgi:two-component system NtrC family sensor kinase